MVAWGESSSPRENALIARAPVHRPFGSVLARAIAIIVPGVSPLATIGRHSVAATVRCEPIGLEDRCTKTLQGTTVARTISAHPEVGDVERIRPMHREDVKKSLAKKEPT